MTEMMVAIGVAVRFVYPGLLYLAIRIWKCICPQKRPLKKQLLPWGILFVGLIGIDKLMNLWIGRINCMICMLHLIVFWGIFDLLWLIWNTFGKKTFRYLYVGCAVLAVTGAYLTFGYVSANSVTATHYSLATEKTVEPLRIVHFANAHAGTTFDGEGFAALVERMQEEKPDVVLITGDFVDDSSSREVMLACCDALGKLQTKYGVYFCFGNHDRGYYDDSYRGWTTQEFLNALRKNHVRVLEDETVMLGDGYCLTGRNDPSETRFGIERKTMDELTAGLDRKRYWIVMDHQPTDFDAQAECGADLVLAGHTHGGQMFPLNWVGEWSGSYDRSYGKETRLQTDFIVTSGISDWEMLFKTGCRSEYNVIDICPSEA